MSDNGTYRSYPPAPALPGNYTGLPVQPGMVRHIKQPADTKRRRLFGRSMQSLVISILVHLGLFVLAGSVVVYKYVRPPKMMFQPSKTAGKLPARKLEHTIRVKQFERQARMPRIMNKLVTKAKSTVSLPDLPPMNIMHTDARSIPSITELQGGHIGMLGRGSMGMGRSKIGLDGFSEAEFFGHRIKTRSVVILVDSSSSIVKKGVFEAVRAEAVKMVGTFHPDTAFNVILFTDGAYAFNERPTYASQAEKDRLRSWMAAEMKINRGNNPATSGSTPIVALETGLSMNPDTIILITDDPPYLKGVDDTEHEKDILAIVRRHEGTAKTRVCINTVAFKPHREGSAYMIAKGERAREFLKKVARSTGGHFREIK